MKKLTVLPLALAVSAALSASAFAADDNLDSARSSVEQGFIAPSAAALGFSMSNSFTIRTFNLDDRDFNDGDGQEYTTMSYENKGSYSFGEQYSMNWWVKVADGVMGYDYGTSDGGGAVDESAELTISSLYARVKNDTLDLQVGLVPIFFGNGYNLQSDAFQGAALQFRPAENTVVHMFGSIASENDNYSDDEDDADYDEDYVDYVNDGYEITDGNTLVDSSDNGDEYVYGIELAQAFTGGGVAMYYIRDYTEGGGDDKQTVGVAGTYKSGDMSVNGEAMTFFGDDGDGTDYAGTQMQLGGVYSLPSGSITTNLYYAAAVDDDKEQVTNINKKGMVQPFNQGLGSAFDHNDGDIQMLGLPTSIFEITYNSGVMGVGLSGDFLVSKPLTLSAGVIYLKPEDADNNTATVIPDYDYTGWEDLTIINAAAAYSFNEYLMAGVGVSYKSFSAENGSDLGDGLGLGASMQFNF